MSQFDSGVMEPPTVGEGSESPDPVRVQVFVNECRMLDTVDPLEAHRFGSLLERVFHVAKVTAQVIIDRDGQQDKRDYFEGALVGVPALLTQAIDELQAKDKFGAL